MSTDDRPDLEAALRADRDGVFRDALLAELRTQAEALRRALEAGVSPDRYPRVEALFDASVAAAEVVELVWRQLHADGPFLSPTGAPA